MAPCSGASTNLKTRPACGAEVAGSFYAQESSALTNLATIPWSRYRLMWQLCTPALQAIARLDLLAKANAHSFVDVLPSGLLCFLDAVFFSEECPMRVRIAWVPTLFAHPCRALSQRVQTPLLNHKRKKVLVSLGTVAIPLSCYSPATSRQHLSDVFFGTQVSSMDYGDLCCSVFYFPLSSSIFLSQNI